MLKLHKDFEIRTSTFQVFSQTKRVGVTFPFAPSNFWDIGLFTTFSSGKKCSWFLPLFVFRFSLCCFLDLSYISQLFIWQPGPFQADVYKICVSFYINILVTVIDIVIFHLSSFDLEDPMIFQWFLNGKVVWCSKENRQSVLLENWEILYSTILPLHPFSCL